MAGVAFGGGLVCILRLVFSFLAATGALCDLQSVVAAAGVVAVASLSDQHRLIGIGRENYLNKIAKKIRVL